ncbi:MAG: hypothetical protein U1E86_07555 [Burkholderiaceae bacterium]
MSRLIFWLFVALDGAAIGLFLLLGLAAAKPSHTPVVSVLGFFLVPVALLAALALLFERAPWPAARPVALALAAAPVLIVAISALLSQGLAWRLGVPADGGLRPDAAAQQALEAAIARGDTAAVARIAGDRRRSLNEGAALVAAIRQLESTPAQRDVLQALLQAGMRADAGGGAQAPLAAAIRSSRVAGVEPVHMLLRAGADPNQRAGAGPVWFAALETSADPALLPALLDRGVDLRGLDMAGGNAVGAAVRHRNWAAAAALIERGVPWQAVRLPDGQDLRQFADAQARRTPDDAAVGRLRRALGAAPATR